MPLLLMNATHSWLCKCSIITLVLNFLVTSMLLFDIFLPWPAVDLIKIGTRKKEILHEILLLIKDFIYCK